LADTKKILVVDDEPKIVEVVTSYLINSGYEVFQAQTGQEALEVFQKVNPHLVVLDLMLPDMMGEEVCQRLRRISRVPIIMLTAKVAEEDLLNGLHLGADDYLTKPFSPRELLARIEVIFRRTFNEAVPLADQLSFNNDDLMIDALKHEVRKQGNIVNLTPNEYKILMSLVKYPQKAFTRDELLTLALGDDYQGFDRTIDTHIKNLRQKIETDPKNPAYILTLHGVGYRFGGE
jgi:DNA-binding response OmpR family regulator